MTMTDVPALVTDLDNEILSLFGVKPPKVGTTAAPVGPSPQVWIFLTNLLRSQFPNYVAIPANEQGFDQEQYELNVIEKIQYLNAWLGQHAQASATGIAAEKAYVDTLYRYIVAGISAAAGGSAAQAIAIAQALFNKAEADLNTEQHARADGDAHAVAVANALAVQATARANAHSDAIHLTLDHDIQVEQAARAAGDAHAVNVAAALATQAEARADAHSDALFNRAESDLSNDVTVLEMKITNGVQVSEAFALDAAAKAAASATAQLQAQLQPQIDKIKTETDTCLDPLCDTVTPNAKQLGNLGNVLKAFQGAGIAALLAGLVAGAVNDPQAAADDIVTAGGWIPGAANEALAAVGVG